MNTSLAELIETKLSSVEAQDALVTEDTLAVDLTDGRTISVPLVWYPRLTHGTNQRNATTGVSKASWIGGYTGLYLDEYISVKGLLLGNPSGESQSSFKKWLESRAIANSKASAFADTVKRT